ncbi:MAG: cytochrome P450 [Lasallia pustulata]|uniref:Cytochrome P450 n=1 Tax=Lasallia pustulata TaxID=136370 RepID=A0A5M8PIW3_9LECA|nr:MAG: cytochrome P450 [Lasallia pustulata]
MPPGALNMVAFSDNIRSEIQQALSDKDRVNDGEKRSIFYELRDNPTLPQSEKELSRLEQEGTLLVMAGTESTAKSMAIAHFHLLSNPEDMSKLRAELQTVPKTASWTQLEQLTYLNGVIAEGNRLPFGVMGRVCRIAPNEALKYKGHVIPPGTPVSSTTLAIHTNEEIFPDLGLSSRRDGQDQKV